MRIAVAMQPTYLPWVGYFDLIEQGDVFVFLDDVQFEHRSWQHRNRIRTPKGLEWLTVPVHTKGRRDQLIRDVHIAGGYGYPQKHIQSIRCNYGHAPFFDLYFPPLQRLLELSGTSLVTLNRAVIEWIAHELGIRAEYVSSSDLSVCCGRTERLAQICRELGASHYLSPLGSLAYLSREHTVFAKYGISLLFHHYEHPEYPQLHEPFLAFAAAIDLLFNAGPSAAEIMRSGRRASLSMEQASDKSEVSRS